MNAKWIIAAGYLLAVPLSAFAGAGKTAVATRTNTPPVVNGHLSDHCWDLAVPTTDFILLDPIEGAPAANQTVVKILYTADQLYIGLFMADSNAENIDTRVVPRDGRPTLPPSASFYADSHKTLAIWMSAISTCSPAMRSHQKAGFIWPIT